MVKHSQLIFLAALFLSGNVWAADLPGKAIYQGTCIACHGPDGKGAIPGTPDFTNPKGPLMQSDAVLKQHILEGFQSPGSPMAMPAKGGNPNLKEQDIHAVLQYLRAAFKG